MHWIVLVFPQQEGDLSDKFEAKMVLGWGATF